MGCAVVTVGMELLRLFFCSLVSSFGQNQKWQKPPSHARTGNANPRRADDQSNQPHRSRAPPRAGLGPRTPGDSRFRIRAPPRRGSTEASARSWLAGGRLSSPKSLGYKPIGRQLLPSGKRQTVAAQAPGPEGQRARDGQQFDLSAFQAPVATCVMELTMPVECSSSLQMSRSSRQPARRSKPVRLAGTNLGQKLGGLAPANNFCRRGVMPTSGHSCYCRHVVPQQQVKPFS
jgi:hypothetical protein